MEDQIKDLSEAIKTAINISILKLKDESTKLSIGDLTKLLELQKELAKEQLREVKVTWSEAEPTPASSTEL